jgi:hypothetical protein
MAPAAVMSLGMARRIAYAQVTNVFNLFAPLYCFMLCLSYAFVFDSLSGTQHFEKKIIFYVDLTPM